MEQHTKWDYLKTQSTHRQTVAVVTTSEIQVGGQNWIN